jgi:hypothetical protein
MSILQFCERIQDAWPSRIISESTWGYPIVGALHVLALALFGAALLIPFAHGVELRWLRRVGLALILTTGTLLFASSAARYYNSTFFRIKLVLLALLLLNAIAARYDGKRMHAAIALVLWAAIIFAARGIAFL